MYRDHFNYIAENHTVLENKLDTDNAHAITMGNLDIEGNSVSGRITTGAALLVETVKAKEERKKKEAELINAIAQLREVLQRMDERIHHLNLEIEQLTELRNDTEKRSEAAFDKMHDLENRIEDITENGFTEPKREALKQVIGNEAQEIDDDEDLIKLARSCVIQEQQNGIAADTEVHIIDHDIASRTKARNDLIKERDEILKHPTASLSQKVALAEEALKRSIDDNSLETGRIISNSNRAVEQALDTKIPEVQSDSSFDFDENISIRPEVTLSEPKL